MFGSACVAPVAVESYRPCGERSMMSRDVVDVPVELLRQLFMVMLAINDLYAAGALGDESDPRVARVGELVRSVLASVEDR